jgi:hypothetical protein
LNKLRKEFLTGFGIVILIYALIRVISSNVSDLLDTDQTSNVCSPGYVAVAPYPPGYSIPSGTLITVNHNGVVVRCEPQLYPDPTGQADSTQAIQQAIRRIF